MARKYRRDARGRFSGTGSTGRVTGGTLAARKSLSRSRQKAAGNAVREQYGGKGSLSQQLSSRAQKAAVTRGSNRLKRAQADNTTRVKGGMAGVVRPSKGAKSKTTKKASAAAGSVSARTNPKLRASFSDAATKRRFNRSGDFALYRLRENQAAVVSGDKKAALKAGRNQVIRLLAGNMNRSALKATPEQRKNAYRTLPRFSTVKNPRPGNFAAGRDSLAKDEIKRLKQTARQDGIGTSRDPRSRTRRARRR